MGSAVAHCRGVGTLWQCSPGGASVGALLGHHEPYQSFQDSRLGCLYKQLTGKSTASLSANTSELKFLLPRSLALPASTRPAFSTTNPPTQSYKPWPHPPEGRQKKQELKSCEKNENHQRKTEDEKAEAMSCDEGTRQPQKTTK